MVRGIFKLQFIGLFAQQEDNTHLNARVLPHPLRGSPLPEGASYLAPRKSVARKVIFPAPQGSLREGAPARRRVREKAHTEFSDSFSGNKLTDKPKFKALAEQLITCETSPEKFFEKFSKFL